MCLNKFVHVSVRQDKDLKDYVGAYLSLQIRTLRPVF
jgi:hypothetical protein